MYMIGMYIYYMIDIITSKSRHQKEYSRHGVLSKQNNSETVFPLATDFNAKTVPQFD